MKIVKHKKGQFIIFATLIIAVMIISIGTIMYSTVTYFRHERWQECLMVVDNIELESQRVVEISLANFTSTFKDTQILTNNLNQWVRDVRKAYPGFGVDLSFTLQAGVRSAYGMSLNYSLGLARHWYGTKSFSAANATFSLNLPSIGFSGYKFIATVFLEMDILDYEWSSGSGDIVVTAKVAREDLAPVTSLKKNSFSLSVDGQTKDFTLSYYYNQTYGSFVYRLFGEAVSLTQPSYVMISVVDDRNIKVVAVKSGSVLRMYNPTDDAWVESKNPNKNFGMQNVIHVRRDPGTPGNIRRTYMKYNLNVIPFGNEVLSARFWVFCKEASPDIDMQIDLYAAASDNWNEATLTWNNAPPPDVLVASTMIDGEGKWCSYDITWFFKQEYAGDKMMSLIIRLPLQYENSSTHYHQDFYSSESNINPPYIEVEYARTPVASFTYSPSSPLVFQTVNFNASASYDPDGFIMEYQWNFGDGTPILIENDPLTTHVFTSSGSYIVTLTVIDIQGLSKSDTKTVSVT